MKKYSIEDLEREIETILTLILDYSTMKQWDYHVRRYHALSIKWCQMRGEQPKAAYIKSDHII